MKYLTLTITIISILITSALAQKTDTKFTAEDLEKSSSETARLFSEGKYVEALKPAKKAVEIAKELFGEDNVEIAKNLRNLGYVQLFTNEKEEAENSFEDAFNIYKKLPDLSKVNANYAAEMAEIIASIKTQQKLSAAEKYFKQAIIWREQADGKDSPKLFTPLAGLANISYWDRDFDKSAELYKRAIEVGSADTDLNKTKFHSTYLRGECAYRKADKMDEFETIKENYSPFPSIDNKGQAVGVMAAKEKPKPETISGGVVNGKAYSLPRPAYPAEARASGSSGKGAVQVQVLIDQEGRIVSACALPDKKTHPLLKEASEIAAYSAKFRPTKLQGNPVTVFGIITYVFN